MEKTIPIELSVKLQSDNILEKYNNELSAQAFNSLYLWQEEMGLTILSRRDFFAVKCDARGENIWFFPVGNNDEIYRFIDARLSEEDFGLCYVSENQKNWLEHCFPERFEYTREEASDEYICDVAEFLNMKGSKFAYIRNVISKIEREHKILSEEITDANVNDALEVIGAWENVPHSKGVNELSDNSISKNALVMRKELGISGVVVYVDGEPQCVFAGYPINNSTIDILVGKTVPRAVNGMMYYGYREYLKTLRGKYVYANHEEDLGISGIRLLKERMRPIKKHIIFNAKKR